MKHTQRVHFAGAFATAAAMAAILPGCATINSTGPPLPALSTEARRLYEIFPNQPVHKAFVISDDGRFGHSTEEWLISRAVDEAFSECKKFSDTCRLHHVNDVEFPGLTESEVLSDWGAFLHLYLQQSRISTDPLDLLRARGKIIYKKYGDYPSHKAFVVADNGDYGWQYGAASVQEAIERAFHLCRQGESRFTETCRLYDINDLRLPGLSEYEALSDLERLQSGKTN